MREEVNNDELYIALFEATKNHGKWEYFYSKQQQYLYLGDGYKYWRMTDDITQSKIINRCKETESYS